MDSKEVKQRLITIPAWEVFNAIEDIPPSKRFAKRKLAIPGTSYTYKLYRPKLFLAIGTTCVQCRVEGTYFALEEWIDGALHFDLYGRDEEGHPVRLTIDHILPHSKGGRNHISNYQAMCRPCNEAKGDFNLSPAQVRLLVKAAKKGEISHYGGPLGRHAARRIITRVGGLVDYNLALVIETTELDGVEGSIPTTIKLTSQGQALLPWARKESLRITDKLKNQRRRKS